MCSTVQHSKTKQWHSTVQFSTAKAMGSMVERGTAVSDEYHKQFTEGKKGR
jgi:hypothetical protein